MIESSINKAVIKGVPLISALLVIAALWIVFDYHRLVHDTKAST